MRKAHLAVPLAALGSSLVLAASLGLPASAAARPGSSSGPLIATGTVKGPSGQVVPGATVSLSAWPSDHVLQGLKPGQRIPTTLLATTKTASNGVYQLRASATALLKAAVYNGYANLEIDYGTASWNLPYRAATASAASSPAAPAGAQTVNLVSRRTRPCSWLYEGQGKPSWARVGQGYVLASGISQRFTYNTGQNSSLGVGVSESGDAGSFHADGTRSESSGQSQNFRTHHKGDDWYQTEFKVAKDSLVCEGQGAVEHRVRSNGYYGGARDSNPGKRPRYQECGPEPGGQKVTTHNEKAVTWSFGFHIDAVDFDGSAQTGYDSSAQLVYKFGNKGGYECGTNNEAPASAPQLIARGP